MIVVVSGSRAIKDTKAVEFILRPYLACKDTLRVGGADGVDAIAEDYGRRYFMTVEVHKAEWDKWGKQAGPIRNRKMLTGGAVFEPADMLVAIWDGKSRGTKNAIETALHLGVETHVHFV